MSATIPIGKLKFTIFGKGYDDERGNSGSGTKESIPLQFAASYAEFDPTGQYCWMVVQNVGLRKYETKNWTVVSQGDVPSTIGKIFKAKNNPNGYCLGLPFSSGDSYIFNLTTNEIISQGTTTGMWAARYDCIDTGDGKYRFINQSDDRGTLYVYTIKIDDFTFSMSSGVGNRAGVGFIDDSSLYAYYPPEWFYQSAYVAAYNLSASQIWGQQASDDDRQFSNISKHGLTHDGKIYVPTHANGVWKLGEYDGTTQVDFITPTYIRAFGNFGSSQIDVFYGNYFPVYSGDRNLAAFPVYDVGVYVTDFDNVYLIKDCSDAYYYPIAIKSGLVLTLKVPKETGNSTMEVFEF